MIVPGVLQPKLVQRPGWRPACSACSSRTMPLRSGRVGAAAWRHFNVHRTHTVGYRWHHIPKSRQRPSCTSGRPVEVCRSALRVPCDLVPLVYTVTKSISAAALVMLARV